MASVAKRKWTYNGVAKEGWEVRYSDPSTGKRPSKTFRLKKEADAFARKVEREIEDGTHVTRDNARTIKDTADEFLLYSAARVRDGRITQGRLDNIEKAFRNHIVPRFGLLPFRELDVEAIDRFYQDLTAGRGLSPTYARGIVVELNLLEQFAVKRRYMHSRPTQVALADLRGIERPRIKTLATADAVAIMRAALKHQWKSNERVEARMACMVHLAACCGMRLGEILALKVEHVDLTAGIVRIRHSMTNRGTIKGPKTASSVRDVPIPAHLAAMLGEWLAKHLRPNPDGLIFTDRNGRQCRHPGVNQNWIRLLQDADLYDPADTLHFHALRHFAGSWWLDNGMKVPEVAKCLGHSDPATTMRIYIHTLTSDDARAAAIEAPAARLMEMRDATTSLALTHG